MQVVDPQHRGASTSKETQCRCQECSAAGPARPGLLTVVEPGLTVVSLT